VTTFDETDFYTDLELINDPHPYFAHLRSQCPVVHLPQHDVMAVTTYDEAAIVLRDHERFSSCNSVSGPFPGFSESPLATDDCNDFLAQHRDELPMHDYVVTLDPPNHHPHRSLVMRLLTPKRVRENEAFMWGLADRQIDEFIENREVEVFREYGQPFALLVIADLLGVPEEDHAEFRRNLGGLMKVTDDIDTRTMSRDPLRFSLDRFSAYVENRRREPRGDVLTKLATATYPDGSVPAVEVISRMASFLFAAGQDTTAKLITTSLRIIAEDPEIQLSLRRDAERIPNFVEEVLRHHGVVKHIGRVARATTEVAGVEIPAGTQIGIFPSSANRDGTHFEDPDAFRSDRPNAAEHLAFGRGVHACPGAALSRLEARVSIERFLARTSDIRLGERFHGPPGARRFEYERIYIMQGLESLHLELDPIDSDQ
jgi:cytochrome P450